MRAPEEAPPASKLGAASRLRIFVGVIVVFASAMAGYVGSLIWPLPTLSAPMRHLIDRGNTAFSEAGRQPSSQASHSIAATPPSATTGLENGVRPGGSDTSTPRGSMVSDPPALTSPPSSKVERPTASRRWAPSATASRIARKQRASGAEPRAVEFAPNPRPNQALRDFMAGPASN
jgi:hypothetical protein